MSFFSSVGDALFGSTEKLTPKDIRSPAQQALFADLVKQSGPGASELLKTAGDPFPSSVVNPTDFTDFQKNLLSQLPSMFSQGDFTQNPLFKQSVDVMSRAAEGFDPYKDTRLTTFRDQLTQEIKRAKDRIASKASSRDSLYGGGRRDEEGQVESQGIRDIGSLMAQLEAESRQQAISAAQQLPNLAMLQQSAPLDFWQQQMSMGDMPRSFAEQTRLAQQQELLRQRNELGIPLQTAMNVSQYSPPLAYQAYSSTPGLLGGPSGVGYQSNGGINPATQYIQAALSALGGAAGAGGLGGAVSGAMAGSSGVQGMNSLAALINQLMGQQQVNNGITTRY